ncbi:YiaA/YiaB family inner membrane protein [Nocardioides lentus]
MTSTEKKTPSSPTTTAFYAQAAISFGLALVAMVGAVLYLPVDPWIRAFLALGTLYLTTSAFTLAKCVRDAQESQAVMTRLDQARVDAILSQHDPFRPLA